MQRGQAIHHAARARALYGQDISRRARVRVHVRPPVAWHASRTSHAAILSSVLHLLIYVVLAVEWMYRVPFVELEPFLDDATIQVALMPSPPAERKATPVLATPTQIVTAAAERVAMSPAVELPPRPEPGPKPKPEPTPAARPRPTTPTVEPTPEPPPPEPRPESKPPPAVTSVATSAALTEPDAPLPPERTEALDAAPDEASEADTAEHDELPHATPPGGETHVGPPTQTPRAPSTPAELRRAQIGSALTGIAHAAAGGSAARAVDIVFLLDLSGSMENNLRAVGENLATMMSELKSRDADATFGVVKFKSVLFLVFPQSTDVAQYERLLANLRVGGDELALDALSRAAEKVEFRPDVQRRFVLVTDEPLKGEPALTRILPQLIAANIIVDVIGLDVRDHRMLARATGGTWHRIPGDKS